MSNLAGFQESVTALALDAPLYVDLVTRSRARLAIAVAEGGIVG